jgi:hypothetical protein
MTFPTFSHISLFSLHPSTPQWVLNPTLPSFDSTILFLCYLSLQLPVKSIGTVNRHRCGSGVSVFAHCVAVQHRARCFIVEATDGSSVAFYTTVGVSRKEEELTPPLTHLETTHQPVSPQHINTEDDTNFCKLIKGKQG